MTKTGLDLAAGYAMDKLSESKKFFEVEEIFLRPKNFFEVEKIFLIV